MPASRLAAMLLACLALAAGVADRALGVTYEPPDGKAYSAAYSSSGLESFQSFLDVTGQPSVAMFTYFNRYPETFSYALRLVAERPVEGALTWQLFNVAAGYDPGAVAGTTGRIARGEVDRYILDRAAELRRWQRPVLLRINHEMNGNWFPWSIRGRDGAVRPDNGYAQYIGLWRRAVILFRGGTRAQIDARLSDAGLPALTVSGESFEPAGNVAFVWCASDGGSDDPLAYYPGDAYVDWVGVDVYAKGTGADPDGPEGPQTSFGAHMSRRADVIYNRFSGPASAGHKPFMIGEWGLWGTDDAGWIGSMFDWVEAHPKVKALSYFNRDASGQHRLEGFPAAARAYAARIGNARYLRRQADVRVYGLEPAPAPEAPSPPPPAPGVEDTTGPTIVLASPSAGQAVTGKVAFRPVVTDPSGVEGVRFSLDGRLADTDAPGDVRYDLDTGAIATGRHVVRIDATDRRGNLSSLSVPVNVRRAPSPEGGATGAAGGNQALSGRSDPEAGPRRRARAVALTPRQLLINQRIAQAAIRRVAALEARLAGRPAPRAAARPRRARVALSLAQLRINHRIALTALRRVTALAARIEGTPVPAPAARAGASRVRFTADQLRATQRISQDALRRLAELEEALPAA